MLPAMPVDQRHLDKDQRLVRHARMEEGKAAAVGLQPVFQIGPAADLVHRLVGHQFFEQRRRRFPGDAAQFEKADIEPVGEQVAQIVGEPAQRQILSGHPDQLGAPVDEKLHPLGQRVELAQQRRRAAASAPPATRVRRRTRAAGIGRRGSIAAQRSDDRLVVGVELFGQQPQKPLATGSRSAPDSCGRVRPRRPAR